MYNLFTTYYKTRSKKRRLELESCLENNIHNVIFNQIYIFSEIPILNIDVTKNTIIIPIKNKPTFTTFFSYINSNEIFKNTINVISNTDIIFNETLLYSKYYFQDNKPIILVLSKYDNNKLNKNAEYSQDVWIFNGHIKPCFSDIELGTRGCDNRIAYELNKSGYNVLNPSSKIIVHHIHDSDFRTYDKNYKPTKDVMKVKVI